MSEATEIDDSVLQPLGELRQRAAALRDFLARSEQARTKVSDAVYRKVTDDYRERLASVEEQAAGLESRARAEYQKVLAEYAQLAAADNAARFAMEELDLRHLVGEIDDEEFAEAGRQPAAIIERCRTRCETLDRLKERFLRVLDVDEAPVVVPSAGATTDRESSMPTVSRTNANAADDASDAGTALQVDHLPAESSAPPPRPAAAEAPAPTPATGPPVPPADETTMLPLGFLRIVEGPGAPAEFVLADTTYIGRGDDCHLRIAHPTVSRHHAIVVGSRDGYRIRDLGSQNGTLVNGEPATTDRLLSDRDEILVGEALLVFSREPGSILSAR